MTFAISIIIGGEIVPAELNDSDTALAIVDKLPIESAFSTWGDEIYFSIPVKKGLQKGKSLVEMGELGYWPPGNAFCIFYGATPGSTEDMIRPASPVDSIGKVIGDPKIFKTLVSKSKRIKIEKA
ncbi:MAG TPA: cyclophilin-like fold protein [Anaerolineae bacterium]|nr:cyclophilin-like fold protein [Anaerolineae bacterium]